MKLREVDLKHRNSSWDASSFEACLEEEERMNESWKRMRRYTDLKKKRQTNYVTRKITRFIHQRKFDDKDYSYFCSCFLTFLKVNDPELDFER